MSALGRVSLRGIVKRFGAFTALDDVALEIEPAEFFALLGPSGSGKTTTLRIIAGLEEADEGTISIDGDDVTAKSPGERDVAMVFQSYALYPHMSVFENIAFSLKMVGTSKAETARLVTEAAARVKIDHLLERRPGQLSGGQQQRCALARAIVRKPRLFLLDEPLSNLDAKLRMETRVELKKLHRALGVTSVYVTHDQEEAMTLADRMALFMEGKIVQTGPPGEIFEKPCSVAVAAFLGSPPMNLIPGTLNANLLSVGGQRVELPFGRGGSEMPVTVGIRPGDIHLEPGGLAATVDFSELLGENMIVNLRFGETLIKMRLAGRHHLGEGEAAAIRFDLDNIHLFDRATGLRLALD
jgi:ABC-type sugar transport system ATPase subunit